MDRFDKFTDRARKVLTLAQDEAQRFNHNYIGTEHLLLGILREERSVAATILMEKGMRLNTVREDIVALLNEKTTLTRVKETPLLAEFSRDLTEAAMKNQLDPLVGRHIELERVQQVLCRRTKNNAVLIGEPGVGKTAIVEGLAQKIVYGDVPHFLADNLKCLHLLNCFVNDSFRPGAFKNDLLVFFQSLHNRFGIIPRKRVNHNPVLNREPSILSQIIHATDDFSRDAFFDEFGRERSVELNFHLL